VTMNRRERHGLILRLIREQPISTQAELSAALAAAGHAVVQTTVSRDIHELGLQKVRNAEGRLVYAPPGTADLDRLRDLGGALRRLMLSCEPSGNLVLITTPSGFAQALSEEIDRSGHPRILGTVAGENTILVVAREGVAGAELADDLKAHLLEGAA
jgi:transcriptional regulator of arginine metabolism